LNLAILAENTCFEHSKQVSKLSALLAQLAGYSAEEVSVIEQAALYHDIGKVSIPPEILNKPAQLTPEEFAIVKTHTQSGHDQISEAIKVLTVAAIVAQEHHERVDGSGYMCLPGKEIHPYAKLIAVADVYDALLSKRVYKRGWCDTEIRQYFKEQSGKQFDADAVSLLFALLDAQPDLLK